MGSYHLGASVGRASAAAVEPAVLVRGNRQWEVAGIAGTSTPSPATSDCRLGWGRESGMENRESLKAKARLLCRFPIPYSLFPDRTAKGRGLSPPALVVAL